MSTLAFRKPDRDLGAPHMRLLFFVGLLPGIVLAQTQFEESVHLTFGTLALGSNDLSSTVTLPRSGRNLEVTGNFVVVDAGVPGLYRLSGFPPVTRIDVEVAEATLSAGGLGIPERINVDQYDIGSVITNQAGSGQFQLGATFSSSGSGGVYEDALYSGNARVRLTYWEPNEERFVSINENVTFDGAIRSSLELEEVEKLHFGTLFAVSEKDEKASIKLSPAGEVQITNAGKAKLLSLSPPRPALIAVGGAAPNHSLVIDVQQADVLMSNEEVPSAPSFVLSSLETLPDSEGITDESGQLEVSVGGTLSTELTQETQVYPAGTYQGTYSLTISY